MKIHKEGFIIITIATISAVALFFANHIYLREFDVFYWLINAFLLVMFYLITQFFRVPKRTCINDDNLIICPADGKVVVIEEVEETEYFNDKRIQISIFMSPMNVHVQWNPISGITKYMKYHKGKYLVAWHPKSSTENERSTVVTEHSSGKEVLFRQIAGAVARRICCYAKENDQVKAGEEFGFIKFGSRVDIFLPLGTKIDVELEQKVQGKITTLAHFE